MRKLLTAALLCLALTAPLAAAAEDESPLELAKMSLTEAWGYTPEETESFVFEDEGQGLLRCFPRDHPAWVYTLSYGDEGITHLSSPFRDPKTPSYGPGEARMRDLLREIARSGWLGRFDARAQGEMLALLLREPEPLRLNTTLAAGLSSGTLSPSQAVEAFFSACLGNSWQRTEAANQWRDLVLEENALRPDAPYRFPVRERMEVSFFAGDLQLMSRFEGEAPGFLKEALSHPRLEGWQLTGGAVIENAREGEVFSGRGLAAFAREDRRLLVTLMFSPEEGIWQLFPVGEKALRQGREPLFGFDDSGFHFQIEYALSESESESFELMPMRFHDQIGTLCSWEKWRLVNRADGSSLEAQSGSEGWRLTWRDGQGGATEYLINGSVFAYLDAAESAGSPPGSLREWLSRMDRPIPEELAMLAGVHLRGDTSSRSRDLGLFHPGTLARVLGWESGDPSPWLHAKIGPLEGYAAANYVLHSQSGGGALSQTRPLPLARAEKDLRLKAHTGWFASGSGEAGRGTLMHVLSETRDWAFVCLPRGEIGWLMDPEGSYGYVRKADISIAPTKIQLDWMEE